SVITFGGVAAATNSSPNCYRFDLNGSGGTWTQVAGIGNTAGGVGGINTCAMGYATLSNGSILCVGGGINSAGSTTNAVYRYDSGTNANGTWTAVANYPFAAQSVTCATMSNGSIICGMGINATGGTSANCYRYDPGA